MKYFLTIFVAILLTATVWAQTPQKMSYQAVIRNSSNALVANTQVGMQISILQGSSTGTVVYTETQAPTTNANGLVSIEIGGGAGFSSIDWASGPFFIKTETDPTGGTNYTITGTSQLLSVPYALYAAKTGSCSYTDLINKPANIDEDKTNDVILTSNQTITGNKTFTGTTTVAPPVNATDAATKAYVDVLLKKIEILELVNSGFSDTRDGNHYDVVKIGNQVWMAENLKYLPSVVGPATGSATTPYYYVYGYNGTVVADAKATTNYTTYGVLYNWPAAMAGATSGTSNPSGIKGVCPANWHLPSDAERAELSIYLGGESVAGVKLKETGTMHWSSPNIGATNETGFTALPGGSRDATDTFGAFELYGFWWSATAYSATEAYYWYLSYNDYNLFSSSHIKELGLSVRCVRD